MNTPAGFECNNSFEGPHVEIFTQYVADNFDHNVRTLDGYGTFHGMAIISATVYANGKFSDSVRRIPRLDSRLTSSKAVKDKCAQILFFNNRGNSPGIEVIKLSCLQTFQRPLVLPALLKVTDLWFCASLFNKYDKPVPNWSGYKQTVCQGEHPQPASVEMLTIIDLTPTDDNCIYSMLMFVQKQSEKQMLVFGYCTCST
jgi:hypothetical protein